MILCLLGFGMVRIARIDPRELKLEILQSKYITKDLIHRPKYGSKFIMKLGGESTLHNISASSFPPFTFPNVDVNIFDEINEIPRIPKYDVSPNCFIRFFIPKIERLLQVGD
jgi:hypothetical protein